MGWFGSSDDDDAPAASSGYGDSNFGGGSQEFSAPSSGYAGGGAGGSFEEQVMMEQQQAIIKAAMFRLTELSFSKCVQKPSSSLSSSEQSCISAVVSKYLETSQFVTQGLMRQR